jgi:hypothetical protein
MQLFGYVLRKPWVKYVDLDIEENVYDQLRVAISKALTANIVLESLEDELCDEDCEVLRYLKDISKDNERR